MDASPDSSSELEIELRSERQEAARRLARALDDLPGPGFVTPRLAGRVDFPNVSVWRSRGAHVPSPFARFDGTIEESGGHSVLVGRVTTPTSGSILGFLIVIPTIAFALLVVAATASTGRFSTAAVGVLFAGLLLGYLYLARRTKKANVLAEEELLVRELRELVRESEREDG